MMKSSSKRLHRSRGFSLIEMVVASSIFIVVMVVAAGAILSIVSANRKSQSAKVAIDNLSFALENMSRHIRVGTSYSCGEDPADKLNCPYPGEGGSTFSFKFKDPLSPNTPAYIIVYRLNGSVLEAGEDKNRNGSVDNSEYDSLTSEEIELTNLKFYVQGSGNGDAYQPHVIILIQGFTEGDNEKYKTEFNLQTSITQRTLDF